jgi:uncharacterized protein
MPSFLPDVNILVYALRAEMLHHAQCKEWLRERSENDDVIYLIRPVLASFLRIVTNKRIFKEPTPIELAFTFVTELTQARGCHVPELTSSQWATFKRLCIDASLSGDKVPDVFIAAAAIDLDAELVSADKDFGRISGLRWRRIP